MGERIHDGPKIEIKVFDFYGIPDDDLLCLWLEGCFIILFKVEPIGFLLCF